MTVNHYIGFDVHKRSVSYCVKIADGTIVEEGKLLHGERLVRQTDRFIDVATLHLVGP